MKNQISNILTIDYDNSFVTIEISNPFKPPDHHKNMYSLIISDCGYMGRSS